MIGFKVVLKRRNDLINYIDNDKYMFLTGNAMCLFGSKINDNKSEIDALNIFDYKSNYVTKSTFKNASSDRIVGDVICTTNLIKHKVIGFQNRCGIIYILNIYCKKIRPSFKGLKYYIEICIAY